MSEEQRQSKRRDFKCEVSARSDHQLFTGFSENISEGGLFISTYETAPMGTQFSVTFSVAGVDREFTGTVEVCWVREYSEMTPHMKPGMGVQFVDLSEKDEQIINAIIQRIDTMFYE